MVLLFSQLITKLIQLDYKIIGAALLKIHLQHIAPLWFMEKPRCHS